MKERLWPILSAKRCSRRRGSWPHFICMRRQRRTLVFNLLSPFPSAWDLSPWEHAATFKEVPPSSVAPSRKSLTHTDRFVSQLILVPVNLAGLKCHSAGFCRDSPEKLPPLNANSAETPALTAHTSSWAASLRVLLQ